MLNVSYKNKIGHFTATEKRGEAVRTYRVDICHANALCAMVQFYTDNNGDNMTQLVSFFADIKHAQNCLKDDILAGWNNFVFNAKECDTRMWKLIRLLAENGKKVTIK